MMKPVNNAVLIAVMAIICYNYAAADTKHHRKTYIVHMDKSVMPSPFSNHLHWYEETLRLSVSKPTDMLYAYNKVMHGFSTRLTVNEAELLKQQHGIVTVREEPVYQLHTTRSPAFLGLDRIDVDEISLPESNCGTDVIVGVVDSGIWPGSKSLDDIGFGPIPNRWKGECETGPGFNKSSCNRKLIGARYFSKAYEAAINGTFDENVESRSPVDDHGHGTHCATTAVGSAVSNASVFGYAKGTARGVAPNARLAVYKACWRGIQACGGSDLLAAFDAAIADGVDILSVSLGSSEAFFWDDIAIGSFKAVSHGIFVSASAGNDGFTPDTLSNVAPWVITVGASSLDRDFPADVTLGNGKKISGASLYTSEEPVSAGSMVPLVLAGDISNKTNGSLCFPGSFPPGSATGKIVICEMGLEPHGFEGTTVRAAGGVGMILANTIYRFKELGIRIEAIPTVVIDNRAYDAVKSYINMATDHNSKANFTFLGTKLGVQPAPIVANFSSRGPNPDTPYLLKPDVIAPGVDIVAGWTGRRRRSPVEFNFNSGTSMACPHVSGLAVLLKIAHPEWSPAAMQSALMTTAYNTYKNGKELLDVVTGEPATPFDLGSGHVDAVSMLDPGLVYDASTNDYLSFLCALNYSSSDIRNIYDKSFECVKGKKYKAEDLNYPSFGVPFPSASGQTAVKYTRTVTNVGTPTTYTVSTSSKSPSVKIKVEPEVLTFTKKNEKKVYTVTFIAGSMPPGTTSFGRLAWSGGKYVVNSPIAFSWD